jgi:hypothetical protein
MVSSSALRIIFVSAVGEDIPAHRRRWILLANSQPVQRHVTDLEFMILKLAIDLESAGIQTIPAVWRVARAGFGD